MANRTSFRSRKPTEPPKTLEKFYARIKRTDGADSARVELPPSILDIVKWNPGAQVRATVIDTGDRAGNQIVITLERD